MERTLVLNASYEPLKIVSAQRAVMMVLAEKAEIVKEGVGAFRSPSISVPVPAVIRLSQMVKVPYKAKIPLNMRAVYARDAGLCQYCYKPATTLDHVNPRSKGGRHEWENLVAACKPCNSKKADKTLKEIGWKLDTKPYAPSGSQWLLIASGNVSPDWEPYLARA
jgi:5-methylcytosine-specific restriction endonuclease McrA